MNEERASCFFIYSSKATDPINLVTHISIPTPKNNWRWKLHNKVFFTNWKLMWTDRIILTGTSTELKASRIEVTGGLTSPHQLISRVKRNFLSRILSGVKYIPICTIELRLDKFVLLKFSFIELCYLCYILIYNVSSDNLSLSILKCFVSNIDL